MALARSQSRSGTTMNKSRSDSTCHLTPIFRVELAGEECRVDEITEHHRELASFRIWGTTFNVDERRRWALDVVGRRLEGSLACPDQDSAVLVARQLLGLDQFDLEVFEISIV